MLKPSEIINAKAFIFAVSQQSNLDLELQAQLQIIGEQLAADPSSLDRAIQRGIELISQYPELEAAYQNAGRDLQPEEVRKGLPPSKIEPTAESSQEILNSVRDVCLNVGKSSQQPASWLDRLLGKKKPTSI